jgi:hypothetical protein
MKLLHWCNDNNIYQNCQSQPTTPKSRVKTSYHLIELFSKCALVVNEITDRCYDCYTNGKVSCKAIILPSVRVILHEAYLIPGHGPVEIFSKQFSYLIS